MTRINLSEYKESKLADALVVETDGGDFTILPPQLWEEAAEDLDDGDIRGLAAIALGGEDNLDAFIAAGGTPTIVASLFSEHYGAPGESSASSRSSRNTPRPSKRTSSATTGSASPKISGRRG